MKEPKEPETLQDLLSENVIDETTEEEIDRSIKILVKILIAVEQAYIEQQSKNSISTIKAEQIVEKKKNKSENIKD